MLDEINDFYQKGSANDGVRESKHFMTTRLLTRASWHTPYKGKTVKCRRQTLPPPPPPPPAPELGPCDVIVSSTSDAVSSEKEETLRRKKKRKKKRKKVEHTQNPQKEGQFNTHRVLTKEDSLTHAGPSERRMI